MTMAIPRVTGADLDDVEFDLDVSIVESGPVVPALMCDTSDNCGGSCNTDSDQPACPSGIV
jgi:FxLD family lantipeptide